MLIHSLSAKPQIYFGFSLGFEILRRPLKALSYQKKDHPPKEIPDFELTWNDKDYAITYNYNPGLWQLPKSVISLKLGGDFPFAKNWHGMLDANLGFINLKTALGQLKGLVRHSTGLFFGAGIEVIYTWRVSHPVLKKKEALQDGNVLKHEFLEDSILGSIEEDLDVFKPARKTLIYPLLSLGWNIPVSKYFEIQLEGQVLFTRGFKTPYYAMDIGVAGILDSSWTTQLSYGTHLKTRCLANIISFI